MTFVYDSNYQKVITAEWERGAYVYKRTCWHLDMPARASL